MRKKLPILLLAGLAILIVIGVEVFFVFKIYRLETERFNYRYREIVQNGLNFIDASGTDLGLANAYYLMDVQSQAAIPFYQKDNPDTLGFKESVLSNFHKTLNQKQNVDKLLKDYLQRMKIDSDFHSILNITYLKLFDNEDTVLVFNQIKDINWLYPDTLEIDKRQIPATHYSKVSDYFEVGINYYVDFNNKKAVVFKKVAGTMIVASLALFMVCLIFLLSVRNLMEESRLSQLKTDFINNMTHELKTPLSTISVATRTLENDAVLDNRDKIKEIISLIKRQNRQLTKQINHLLEISMWEKKQFSLDQRMIELEPFFEGIAESFRWECQERTCKLDVNFNFVKTTALLDEVQMTVALHNLLINAIKYAIKDPEVVLHVQCDDRLIIAVTDNGIGIGKEDMKHIFDKFYRVSTGNIHKVKGLGLGLFYVKQIVEAHGGTVEVTSRPGKGSTFTLNLPVNGKS